MYSMTYTMSFIFYNFSQTKMSATLKCERNFLKFLAEDCISKAQGFAIFSTLSDLQVKAITEIFHNLLFGELHLKDNVKSKIRDNKKLYEKIAKQSSFIYKKKLLKENYLEVLDILFLIKTILKKVW